MKFLFFLLLFSLSLNSFSQDRKQTIDKIVAQIGDNIILKSDIDAQKLQAIQSGVDVSEETDCMILEQLMFQNLLLNQAQVDSVMITDEQVDAEMENRIRVIENQIGGRDKMEAFYGKTITDIKNEFRLLIRNRLLSEEMERRITQDVTVTPKEIEVFFNSIPKDSIPLISSKLSFQQIVIFPDITKEDKDLAWQKLDDIRKEILKGKSFETQARIHSQDPGSAQAGGKLEATRGMMVPQFEAAVFSAKEGEISPVFETDYGYHIVQLLERKGDDYVCRHILITPEFNRESLAKSSEKIEECYKALKENSITWENAVTKYSNDLNSKQNRGIITNPITGEQTWSMEDLNQVDQQIYLLTDALGKNEISKPSFYFDFNERKQGIRIVRLMNRTEPHYANLNDDYSLIQSATLNKKKETTLTNWINAKVVNAYVRIDKEFSCNFRNNWNTTP
jgi:peptidyl-prolyl cis-trans isomerase SurA